MTARPWMRIWIADYLQETAPYLDLAQHGALHLLLYMSWHSPAGDGSLPNDMALLREEMGRRCRGSKLHKKLFDNIVPDLLSRYFVLGTDGRLRNPRLILELKNACERSAKASQSALKKGRPNSHFNRLYGAPAQRSHSVGSASQMKEVRKEVEPSPVSTSPLFNGARAGSRLNQPALSHKTMEDKVREWNEMPVPEPMVNGSGSITASSSEAA